MQTDKPLDDASVFYENETDLIPYSSVTRVVKSDNQAGSVTEAEVAVTLEDEFSLPLYGEEAQRFLKNYRAWLSAHQ